MKPEPVNFYGENNLDKQNAALTGVVTSRKCPECGHHEIGFMSKDGTFHPLKPGAKIQLLDITDANPPSVGHHVNHGHTRNSGDEGDMR